MTQFICSMLVHVQFGQHENLLNLLILQHEISFLSKCKQNVYFETYLAHVIINFYTNLRQ